MAKKVGGTNIIEQHVEKAVLGVSLLVALFFLVNWAFSSPRKIELAGNKGGAKTLAPGELDKALADMAQQLEEHMGTAKPKEYATPNLLADIQAAVARPGNDQGIKDYIAFTSGRKPLTGEKLPGSQKADLEAMLAALAAPETPLVEMNREVLLGANPNPDPKNVESQLKEVIVAHVACVFDHAATMKKWLELTDKTLVRPQIIVVAVEAQRQQRKGDGTWGEAETVSMTRIPSEQALPAVPAFDEQNAEDVRTAIQHLVAEQKQIAEPDYYNIIWPNRAVGTWMIKGQKPRTRVSDLLGTASSQPAQGQPLSTALTQNLSNPMTPGSPAPSTPAPAAPGGGGMAARKARAEQNNAAAPEPAAKPRGPSGPPPGAGPSGRGPRDMGGGVRGPGAPAVRPPTQPPVLTPAKPEDGVELVLVPDIATQINSQLLESWFHDERLADGVTYRYQVRLVLANPLFGYTKDVAKESDAKAVTINTPWSAWSEPVSARRATEFFVQGASAEKQEANVVVFAQKWGQRVKRQFTVRPGEMIGQEVTMSLPGLDGKSQATTVDFRTGVLFVDADWDKTIRLPRNSMATRTAELLCQDSDGRLFTRMDARDRMQDRLIRLNKECQTAAAPAVSLAP